MVHFLEHFKAIPVMFYINLPWTYQRYERFAIRVASGLSKRHILFINNNVITSILQKHGRGGQSALRFARLRMEKRHNYVRKVST